MAALGQLMKFLIDRCAGRVVADWLRATGHDVVEARERAGYDLVALEHRFPKLTAWEPAPASTARLTISPSTP